MDLKSLENEALGLSSQERAQLAFDLIESLESLSPTEIEQLWTQEALRRGEQIDARAVALTSSEDVSAKAHALLR
ncbi:addiction module protein [Dyella nitratireducens]|uniref:Addiction module antitoxin RelB n=1 Tax=Dyella nitratireducens TaxID=1849580 RepID=A0ABQ1FXE7_9GAMM|nr:addiction module protein [Dyella nitratireducens]GGA31623.1 hypothetical protein GCM10010981_20940 [Dyella nitratireducens]GLQ42843.1 hypothetical protein GCM10007902_26930 [Dyella nitratireducens]